MWCTSFAVFASDLRANWMSWLAVACSMVVGGWAAGFALATLMSGGDEVAPLGGSLLGFAVTAIVVVSLGQTRLLIGERRIVYAHWKLVGMPPFAIFLLVMGQVVVVSIGSSAIGALAAEPFLAPAAQTLRDDGVPMPDLHLSAAAVGIAVAVCAGSAVMGAVIPSWSVARRSAVASARPRQRPWAKWLKVFLAAGGVVGVSWAGLAVEMDGEDTFGFSFSLLVLAVMVMPWLLPALVQTSRLCDLFGATAAVAGANVRTRLSFLSPQLTPWILLVGMIASLGSAFRVMRSVSPGESVSSAGVFVVMLAPAFGPAVAAALATTLLMRHRLARDVRGLHLAGAPRAGRMGVQVWEATILTVLVGAIALALAVVMVAATQRALTGDYLPAGWWRSLWWQAALGFLAAMWTATVAVKCSVAYGEERRWRAERLGAG